MSDNGSASESVAEHPSGLEANLLARLLGNIRECSDLRPAEKETVFRIPKGVEQAPVYTESRAFMSSLLLHPHFTVTEIRECGTDCKHPPRGKGVGPHSYSGGAVTGVKGTLDVGALKVNETARTVKDHSRVISDGIRDHDPRKVGGEFP
jgi:hypothetical protein